MSQFWRIKDRNLHPLYLERIRAFIFSNYFLYEEAICSLSRITKKISHLVNFLGGVYLYIFYVYSSILAHLCLFWRT